MPILHARPRTSTEVAELPDRPDVVAAAKERGVEDVLHFTTVNGAIGILAAETVKSRKRLPEERYLEHVYQPNVEVRKDPAWLDYVNLSISRINDWMFNTSVRWHGAKGNPWVVLAFSVELLGQPGVAFTTTNNIYPACRRAEGVDGFNQLFAEQVRGRYDSVHRREGKQRSWPTDRQAEVLYPGEVPCKFLRRIDVQKEETIDTIAGILGGLGFKQEIPVQHSPEVFR